jgi:hypothetical protein
VAQISPISSESKTLFLGPFVGGITDSSVKIWLNIQEATTGDQNIYVTLKPVKQGPRNEAERFERDRQKQPLVVDVNESEGAKSEVIPCLKSDLGTGVVTIHGLSANTQYSYQLWQDAAHTIKLNLNPSLSEDVPETNPEAALQPEDLYFWTLPNDGYGRQLDFLLMSCHKPETSTSDGYQGFGVWRQLPTIMKENANVRFAILAGDQIYADDVEAQVLAERDPLRRKHLYLTIYKKFWDNVHYRRVLCRLPAILMWDDHDITDGWGSREDSFQEDRPQEFTLEWKDLFETAREMFTLMQASRNPPPLFNGYSSGFDTCFRIGKAGFVIADLRSNRNVRFKIDDKGNYEGRIWLPEQRQAIRNWVEANKEHIDTLFFVSSVVFSHGAPQVETWIMDVWFRVLNFVKWVQKLGRFKKLVAFFNSKIGDLRDDINDSWGVPVNAKEADRVLDFFFDLENPRDAGKRLNVVILSGDIHTPGYSTIYSSAEKDNQKRALPEGEREGRAVIPHIVATPVAYEPFSWVGEAVFRHLTKVVKLGESGIYTSQVSHHFCYRNVVVVSLRNYSEDPSHDESHLKVKYYLEGFREPQVMLFDLNHGAHRENIEWPAAKRNKWLDRRPEWIRRRLPSSWFPPESKVDQVGSVTDALPEIKTD